MGPINYLQSGPDPFAGLQESMMLSAQIRQARDARAKAEQEALLRQQYEMDTRAAMANPSPQAFASLAVKYPQHREAYKQAWDQLGTDRQQTELRDGGELVAALQAGRGDVAISKLDQRIEAVKNSGGDTKTLEMLRQQVEADPKAALGSVLRVVSALPGSDKLLENLGKLGTEERAAAEAPAKLSKAQADAQAAASDAETKRVQAKYADSNAILDLQKKGWDIKKIEEDIAIAKLNSHIAALNATIAREGNDLKREELRLKLDEAKAARDAKVREKVATAETGAGAIDNMLNTIERIKTNGSLGDVLGSIEGRLPAMLTSGMDDEESDAIALIETLGSQAFLAQIPNIKGTGALSNTEGDKLQAALQNLGRAQSEKQFRANLDEAARLLNKGREGIAKSTGVPLGKPDTPAAPGARPPLSSFER